MQLMSRENFEYFLMETKPSIEWVIEQIEYTTRWSELLRNGGTNYAEDVRKIGYEYIKKMSNENNQNK